MKVQSFLSLPSNKQQTTASDSIMGYGSVGVEGHYVLMLRALWDFRAFCLISCVSSFAITFVKCMCCSDELWQVTFLDPIEVLPKGCYIHYITPQMSL